MSSEEDIDMFTKLFDGFLHVFATFRHPRPHRQPVREFSRVDQSVQRKSGILSSEIFFQRAGSPSSDGIKKN